MVARQRPTLALEDVGALFRIGPSPNPGQRFDVSSGEVLPDIATMPTCQMCGDKSPTVAFAPGLTGKGSRGKVCAFCASAMPGDHLRTIRLSIVTIGGKDKWHLSSVKAAERKKRP